MSNESTLHRALTIGAIALAAFFGGNFGPPSPIQNPARQLPIQVPVHNLPILLIRGDDERWQEMFPTSSSYGVREPPAGAPPGSLFNVRLTGKGFSTDVPVWLPDHYVGSSYRLGGLDDQKPQVSFTYQMKEGARPITMNANLEAVQSKLTGLLDQHLDLAASGVESVKITPLGATASTDDISASKANHKDQKEEGKGGVNWVEVLGAVYYVLGIAHIISEKRKKHDESRPDETAPSANRRKESRESLFCATDANGRTIIMTEEHIDKLDGQTVLNLKDSVTKNFALWKKTVSVRQNPDPTEGVHSADGFDRLQSDLCADFRKLKGLVEGAGLMFPGFKIVDALCPS